MKRRHIFLWIAATVAAALLVLSTVTIGLPVGARIIDASTRRPVEDVVVVGAWQVEAGTLAGSVPAGALYAAETVTGADGRFSFPLWVRLHRPFFPLSFRGLHHSQDPELLIYTRDHVPRIVDNAAGRRSDYDTNPACCALLVTSSWWTGKDITLEKWDPSLSVVPDVETVDVFEGRVIESFRGANGRLTCDMPRVAEMLRRLDADLGDISFLAGNHHIVRACGHEKLFSRAGANR